MSKRIGSFIIIGLILLFSYQGYNYLHYRSINAVSDAAFIKSDHIATLSFQVGGKVVTMTKDENEPVKKGELLAEIDATDFEISKDQMLHTIESLKKSIESLKLQKARLEETLDLHEQIAKIDIKALDQERASLRFQIEAAKTRLKKLDKDVERYRNMLKQNLIASTEFETVLTSRDALADEIEAMEKRYDLLSVNRSKAQKAHELSIVNAKEIKELTKRIEAQNETLKSQQKSLKAIEQKIAYTKLYAPFDGVVAKKFITPPHVVKKGAFVYALTDPKQLYCEVLLSEKKMHGVKQGSLAIVKVDAIKDRTYQGIVESIAPTSASTFSLVPRDIASGEFTKLDQRFVVRIKLDSVDGLRAGMGATVAIKRD